MFRSIVFMFALLMSACSSYKPKFATKEELQQYKGVYYVTFTFTPENSHLMIMGGIGDNFEVNLLKKDSLEQFAESFYKQLIYTPILLESAYWHALECLSLNKDKDMANWFNSFHSNYLVSNLIEEHKLKLQDGNFIIISKYKFLEELEVIFVEDFKKCLISSSIELDINKIKSIDKVAVLLDKED